MKATILTCVCALVFCVIGLAGTNGVSPEPPKWEYKVATGYELADVQSVWQLLDADGGNTPPEKRKADEQGAAEDNPDPLTGLAQLEIDMAAAANNKITNGMNKLGDLGWELVAISHESSIVKRSYTFKRKRS